MELTVLGSGTVVLQPNRGPAGYLLKVASRTFLLDGGTGSLLNALRAGVSYFDIDNICYTHLHPDHTSDLVPFLFGTKYTPGVTRRKKLSLFGPVGFQGFFDKLVDLYGRGMVQIEYSMEIRELGAESLSLGDLTIRTRRMQHAENAIGYRFEWGDKIFVYSGDTDFCGEIVELARGADLLLIECSFPDDKKVRGHLTPSEVGEIAATAGAKKVLLTHIYPPFDESAILDAVSRRFGGEIRIAHDLERAVI